LKGQCEIEGEREKKKNHRRQIEGSLVICTVQGWRGCRDDLTAALEVTI
jgi:hypothetical protein